MGIKYSGYENPDYYPSEIQQAVVSKVYKNCLMHVAVYNPTFGYASLLVQMHGIPKKKYSKDIYKLISEMLTDKKVILKNIQYEARIAGRLFVDVYVEELRINDWLSKQLGVPLVDVTEGVKIVDVDNIRFKYKLFNSLNIVNTV